MQLDKVINIKCAFFYKSNDHKEEHFLIIQYTKQTEILTLLDPRFEGIITNVLQQYKEHCSWIQSHILTQT